MAIDKKDLKKMFPNLYRELEGGDCKVPINAVRKNVTKAEESQSGETEKEEFELTVASDKFRHYNPSAVDFIRRCDTEIQAEEIIAYMQKKGEITEEYANELRCKVKRDGVRCFGPKKEENYYFREGGIF